MLIKAFYVKTLRMWGMRIMGTWRLRTKTGFSLGLWQIWRSIHFWLNSNFNVIVVVNIFDVVDVDRNIQPEVQSRFPMLQLNWSQILCFFNAGNPSDHHSVWSLSQNYKGAKIRIIPFFNSFQFHGDVAKTEKGYKGKILLTTLMLREVSVQFDEMPKIISRDDHEDSSLRDLSVGE